VAGRASRLSSRIPRGYLAALRQTSVEELAERTSSNFRTLFSKAR
jgi:hypothetical protein